jgi:hypothetical protein
MDLRARNIRELTFDEVRRGSAQLVGAILWISAGLKLFQLLHDLIHFSPWSSTAVLELLAISTLAFTATLIITHSSSREAWLTVAMTMTGLAAVSLTYALAGERDCGCFGALHLRPWGMFLLDVVLVAVSYFYSFSSQSSLGSIVQLASSPLLDSFAGLAILTMLLVLMISISWDRPLSGHALFARQKPLPAMPIDQSLEWVHVRIPVRNVRSTPVTIVGRAAVCGMHLHNEIPFSIPARSTIVLELDVKLGVGARRGDGYLDCYVGDEAYAAEATAPRATIETTSGDATSRQRVRLERIEFSVIRAPFSPTAPYVPRLAIR